MDLNLKDILQAIGPNSALIFAAWIFMDFLQQRYLAALDRYRSLIAEYRDGEASENRRKNIGDQVILYKQRCELMKMATNLGLTAAILLIATLLAAALNAIFSKVVALEYISASCALIGLGLVIIAAAIAIKENSIIQRIVDGELLDVSDLARRTGQKPGAITDE